MRNLRIFPTCFLVAFLPIFVWSSIHPFSRFTWFLEVAPIFIGLGVMFGTAKRFPLSNLCYALIWGHMVILCVGGHYTYAREPVFEWLKETFHLARNHYDRLGHFAQGFVPAIIAREIFLRLRVIPSRKWMVFLIVCLCLAISACYEFVEWWTALATGDAATDFLGTQGDPWDTQSDMFTTTIGAITALLFLGQAHDRSLEKIPQ